jgi:hypothetical protein
MLRASLEAHDGVADPDLEDLLAAEAWGRRYVDEAIGATA